jgi:hypothetical protein
VKARRLSLTAKSLLVNLHARMVGFQLAPQGRDFLVKHGLAERTTDEHGQDMLCITVEGAAWVDDHRATDPDLARWLHRCAGGYESCVGPNGPADCFCCGSCAERGAR